MRARFTCRTSASSSSSAGTVRLAGDRPVLPWWRSSAACAATSTWATSTSTCGGRSCTCSCPSALILARAADRGWHADDASGQRRGVRPLSRARWAPTAKAQPTPASRSPAARWRPLSPSSTWAPTAAASSAPTLPIRSRTPTAWTNFLECVSIILLPFASLVMFGRMLKRSTARGRDLRRDDAAVRRHGRSGPIYFDTLQPNPALTAHAGTRPIAIDTPDGRRRNEIRRPWPVCRSISRWATWKARNCASAPRPAPTWAALTTTRPTVRSTACTTA